jgi:hypothetical protein
LSPRLVVYIVVWALIAGPTVALPIARILHSSAKAAAAADVTVKPDQRSAMIAAHAVGHRVRIASDDSATASTYANPDGSLTQDDFASPQRVRRGDGWVPVDTTLHATSSGYETGATPAAETFGGAGSTNAFSVAPSSAQQLAVDWASKLPAPTVDGSTATYPNVAPGLDLQLTATVSGVEAALLLTQRPTSAPSFHLPLRPLGLTVTQDATGMLHFANSAGVDVFVADKPLMWGSTIDRTSGEPTRSEAVAVTLSTRARR